MRPTAKHVFFELVVHVNFVYLCQIAERRNPNPASTSYLAGIRNMVLLLVFTHVCSHGVWWFLVACWSFIPQKHSINQCGAVLNSSEPYGIQQTPPGSCQKWLDQAPFLLVLAEIVLLKLSLHNGTRDRSINRPKSPSLGCLYMEIKLVFWCSIAIGCIDSKQN